MNKIKETMTAQELDQFLKRFDLSNEDFADVIGVTPAAVHHWLHNNRSVPPTTVKLVKFFSKYPNCLREF